MASLATRHRTLHVPLGGTDPVLSVCAWCKRIRDEHGQWLHFDADPHAAHLLSHGLCPECRIKVQLELERHWRK